MHYPHTEEIYLDQPYAKIMWKAADNCLHVEWRAYPSAESFNAVLVVQRYIIRKHGCTKVVVNNKALRKPLPNAAF